MDIELFISVDYDDEFWIVKRNGGGIA